MALANDRWDRNAAQTSLVEARKLRGELTTSPSPSKEQYLRCVRTYQRVYLKDPHFGGSDDAIYEAGVLYQEMGERFNTAPYYRSAAKLFRFLIRDYKASPRVPDALLRLANLCSGPLKDEEGAQQAYEQLQTQYKSSKAAASIKAKKPLPQSAASVPPEQPPVTSTAPQEQASGPATVHNIRHWSTSDYTRIIIDMDFQTRYARTRIASPDRIFFDISNARLSQDLLNKTFVVGDAFLKQVRVAQNRQNVVRVVLDFASIGDYTVFELHEPFRIVVDIHGDRSSSDATNQITRQGPAARESHPNSNSGVSPAPPEKPTEPQVRSGSTDSSASRTGSSAKGTTATAADKTGKTPQKQVAERPSLRAEVAPVPTPPRDNSQASKTGQDRPSPDVREPSTPSPSEVRTTQPAPVAATTDAGKPSGKAGQTSAPVAAAQEILPPPKAAAPTSRGDRTLTRMLGLKIGRIVLDPGHGGHDTGTIGKGGLLEKDLVLQVARVLKRLLEDKLGAEVVLTRESDTFISLEERTAIANQARADLFISIHANSSRSRTVSGVETYYLNFARTNAEREVAARENATSVHNVSDLQDLIHKIAQADKSSESRELAAIVQTKLFGSARQLFPSARNRGVRSAPFVVLIGANMPSVLAEVAFISNPSDEKILKQDNNRQRLAQALFAGIEGYMRTLGTVVAQSNVGSN